MLLFVMLLAAGALLGGLAAWAISGRVEAMVVGTITCVAVGAGVAQATTRGGQAAPMYALGAAGAVGVVLRVFAGQIPVVGIVVADLGLAIYLRWRRNRMKPSRRDGLRWRVPVQADRRRGVFISPELIALAHRPADEGNEQK